MKQPTFKILIYLDLDRVVMYLVLTEISQSTLTAEHTNVPTPEPSNNNSTTTQHPPTTLDAVNGNFPLDLASTSVTSEIRKKKNLHISIFPSLVTHSTTFRDWALSMSEAKIPL